VVKQDVLPLQGHCLNRSLWGVQGFGQVGNFLKMTNDK